MRMSVRMRVLKMRASEYVRYDSFVARTVIAIVSILLSSMMNMFGKRSLSRKLLMYLHRNAVSPISDAYAESMINKLIRNGDSFRLEYIQSVRATERTRRFFHEPQRLVGTRVLVLKSPESEERGVMLVDYSFVFPLLARRFGIGEIMQRYHIVIEPSWSGACDDDVLALSEFGNVFVQSNEPRDIEFMKRSGAELTPVPIAANWWVDTRVFRPLDGIEKDADILINASWAKFKRHERIFAALSRLRRRGRRLKAILVGYEVDLSRTELTALAAEYGILDQLEFHEGVTPTEVNVLLNRSRVNLIWSRREGSNRAVIEGMSAGVPGIMRCGFNYGHQYPFVSENLVEFATEDTLPNALLRVIDRNSDGSPRTWIERNMNPQIATTLVDEVIGRYCCQHGEKWTRGKLAVKVSSLHAMEYWEQKERERFLNDYTFIRGVITN